MIEVVNRRHGDYNDPGDIYVGRGSRWGNPFRIGIDGTREKVIRRYEAYLNDHDELVQDLTEIVRSILESEPSSVIRLVCWCAPEACHASTLAERVELRIHG